MAGKLDFQRTPGTGYERADLRNYRYTDPVGTVFWVNSVTGTDSAGYGLSPGAPNASVDYAIGRCTADNGDVICVMPGHVETITAAAGVALDVAGVTIRGLGKGRQRPKFNFTTAIGASFDVSAARCTVENCVFTAGFDAITAMINVSGADFTFQDNEVEFTTASFQSVLALLTAATADRLAILRNYFHGSADAGTAACIRHVAGADVRIEDNIIKGNFTTTLGGIDNTAAVAGIQIHRNVISNQTASAAKAFVLHGSTTGEFSNNRLAVLTGTAPITAAAGTNCGGNYYSAAAGVGAATLL